VDERAREPRADTLALDTLVSARGLAYIRQTYGVPAYRGQRVLVRVDGGQWESGTVTGARGPHVAVRTFSAPNRRPLFHPTDEAALLWWSLPW